MNAWLKALLSIAAIIVILIGGFVLFMLGQDFWRTQSRGVETTDVVNVDPTNETIVERLYLSDITRIGAGPMSRATLYLSQDFEMGRGLGSYSKSSESNALNMLFVEPGAAERWLFPTNDQLIYSVSSLSLTPIGTEQLQQPEAAMLLQVITQDSNGDQRLSESDRIALMVTHPDGRGMVTLIEDQQGSVDLIPDATAFVLSLETATGVELLRIDPTNFAILERQPINFPK